MSVAQCDFWAPDVLNIFRLQTTLVRRFGLREAAGMCHQSTGDLPLCTTIVPGWSGLQNLSVVVP
jgi:hypothetical protein